MMNSSNEEKKSYVCGGREGGSGVEGARGLGRLLEYIACYLCNFYDTQELNFH